MKKGFSLIEILVVIGLFALIGIVTTQAVLTSLKGSRIVDSEANIRQNVNYAMNVIERNLRNAKSITTPCPNNGAINYQDQDEMAQSISLVTSGNEGYIAINGTNRLTSPQVRVTAFTVTCSPVANPSQIDMVLTAVDPNATSDEAATVTTSNKVVLRTNN
jgi:prepilin-type N-terminal cleavage/methylation domain-containing protein